MVASINHTSVCYKSQHLSRNSKRLKSGEDSVKKKSFQSKASKKKEIEVVQTVEDIIRKEEYIGDVPEGDVYFIKDYPPQSDSLQSVLRCHRDYAQPSMFNNMSGKVYIHFDLDMSAKKQSKSKPNFNDFLIFPHKFEPSKPVRCVVICQKERKQEAQELGALHAGGDDLIQMLHPRKGTIHSSTYDLVLCTPDMFDAVFAQKVTFRSSMPSEEKGTVSDDIQGMLEKFKYAVFYSSNKEGRKGTMQIQIGTLDMPDEHLKENLEIIINAISSKYRNTPLIDGMRVLVPPSPEQFLLDNALYVPNIESKTDKKDLNPGKGENVPDIEGVGDIDEDVKNVGTAI
ncbi:hypothetical protein FSP39_015670 [Pinctada imbricata]|uniref:Uncharacterized protein n=1 Tax=Pinctada imbricata TaxID=66713 RepID=A0AA89BPU5_PINIB|nr:hypothetical protein FSP39_015670 [Pinctada imbricata]